VGENGLRAATEKMEDEGVPRPAIDTFRHYHDQLVSGASGLLRDADLEPVGEIDELEALPEETDAEALDRTIVLKLNGGLGTSMGMTAPKSLIEAKDGLSFLDVTVRQVLGLRERTGARLPLVLMNSFSTRDATLRALEAYPELGVDVPADFVQNKEPKIRADDLTPVEWPADPALEWCPPGHGDIYTALLTSGMLETLLERGYEYAFMSNSDNLGAVLEPRVLAWFAREEIPFLMEVTRRTEADRKGGHLARRRGGGLVLRETAQTPEEDLRSLQDLGRWGYANTNNLWLNLRVLARVLDQRSGVLGLPLIINRKTVDPSDASSPEVVQLETAMGAAVGVFAGARALLVPRARFAPVKTTNDLLVLRSDAYVLADDGRVRFNPDRGDDEPPFVDLDPPHYKLLRDFDARFPAGPPSLVACERLVVRGDVRFGRGVVLRGPVEIRHDGDGQLVLGDGEVVEGAAAGRPSGWGALPARGCSGAGGPAVAGSGA
jgi:UTP--glucose-1-phosphate uridylyltransferase